MGKINILHGDCMEAMASMKDKEYELAIVDPIFGELMTQGGYCKNNADNMAKSKNYNTSIWTQPKTTKEYFKELLRVSKEQIIWGGNYFIEEICRNTSCMIVWDKDRTGNFADAELAWTSFDTATRIFKYRWNGMLQQDMKNKEIRIHPTQKPVALYQWLLKNYAKQGDRILDTHGGSCSSAIACDIMGFDADIYEIDKDYYEAAVDRFSRHKQQQVMEF